MGWKLGVFVLGLALFFPINIFADAPTVIPVGLDRSFVPVGFDDNDRTEIHVAGVFPDTCYKVGPTRFDVDKTNKIIAIEQSAYHYSGVCIRVIVPYSQKIELGILESGNYQLKDATSGKMLGSLPVGLAKTESADDFLYAPVSDAQIRNHDGKNYLYLRGSFTDRCMTLKEVVIHYYQEVIVVQPIAKYEGTADNCGYQMIRYHQEVPLKEGITGDWLVHVRSMDGKAVDRFAQFP